MSTLSFELLQEEIDYVLANQDWAGAFEAYNLVNDWLERSALRKKDPAEYRRYLDYLMKLKFLSLNYFDDVKDYQNLIKDYFSLSQEMPGFDLWQKIEVQLLTMRDLVARDEFKAQLREALERSENILINRQKYNDFEMPYKVSDWIKDFVANLGLDNFDNLKKVEYLASGKNIQKLDDDDKDKVKNLLDIYEKLKLSSRTPEGYENSVLMDIDGKKIVFNRGEVEEINNSLIQDLASLRMKEGENLSTSIPTSSSSQEQSLETPAETPSTSAPTPSNPLKELEAALKKYPAGSLEHKAIKEELSRLKAGGLRQAQQADQGATKSSAANSSRRPF